MTCRDPSDVSVLHVAAPEKSVGVTADYNVETFNLKIEVSDFQLRSWNVDIRKLEL
jgi:hypothetical protein